MSESDRRPSGAGTPWFGNHSVLWIMNESDEPKIRLYFILVPMWLTFFTQRLILHHSSPGTHVFIAGYLVHHLFWGILFMIPTAFLFAMGMRTPRLMSIARVVLGFSSAMVLDEVIYLICTDGSGVAYRGSISLWGAAILMSVATVFLISIHFLSQRRLKASDGDSETVSQAPSQRE
jgi:hypothetical protein